MSDNKLEKVANILSGFSYLSVYRQIGILVGIAASIALGVALAMWASSPDLRPLFTQLEPEDVSQLSDALEKKNIPFQLDSTNAAILVPAADVYKIRVMMASEGLPKGSNNGYGILKENVGFMGGSQFLEKARYVHAMEMELAKTIRSIQDIRNARVHLALPKQSIFASEEEQGSASVFVELPSGRVLSADQVSAIVYLISSSVPHINAQKVTVVDQQGRLLSEQSSEDGIGMANKQFRQTAQVEQMLSKKIEDLLTPLYGAGRVKARVSADLDFTHTEQTKEVYQPEDAAIRSEQTLKESNGSMAVEGGVPGAATNQPAPVSTPGTEVSSGNHSRLQTTRNYEVDRTISHIQHAFGTIERLSIAVIVDDKTATDQNGQVTRTPLTAEDLQKVTSLVREAVGYNAQRGDKVTVINSSFSGSDVGLPAANEPAPFHNNPIFWMALKYGLGAIGVILILFGVLKPFLGQLLGRGKNIEQLLNREMTGYGTDPKTGRLISSGVPGMPAADPDTAFGQLLSYQEQMKMVRDLAKEDPKRVAQVVRQWLESD